MENKKYCYKCKWLKKEYSRIPASFVNIKIFKENKKSSHDIEGDIPLCQHPACFKKINEKNYTEYPNLIRTRICGQTTFNSNGECPMFELKLRYEIKYFITEKE